MDEEFDFSDWSGFSDPIDSLDLPPPVPDDQPLQGDPPPMSLAPPTPGMLFTTIEMLVDAVNAHAKPQGYAVVKGIVKRKKELVHKAYLRCDKGGKYKEEGSGKRHTGTRMTECPFSCTGVRTPEGYLLEVRNGTHNHEPMASYAHPVHRLADLTPSVQKYIHEQSITGTRPFQILSRLSIDQPEVVFKRQDIYNTKTVLKKAELNGLSPAQALIQSLDESPDWEYAVEKDPFDRITHLFFWRIVSLLSFSGPTLKF
jgi:hypothetical protein